MSTHPVRIVPPMAYKPASLSVEVGDTVEWKSEDSNDVHTVTHDSNEKVFGSDVLNGGDKFKHTFTKAGDYPYYCEIHGKAMAGTVKVT